MAKLEVEFQAELRDAWVARRTHSVVRREDEVGRTAANRVGMVEGVESLEAELSGEALAELYVLEQREVGAPEAGATDGSWALGGFRSLSCGRSSESGCIEPIAEGMRSTRVGVADLIRTATQRRRDEKAA